jgi:hypothetical protein
MEPLPSSDKRPPFYRDLFLLACVLLVLAKAGSYWLLRAYERPEEPLETGALYRGDDIQYFPLIKALGDFDLRESVTHENAGNGVRSFPFASVLPHALFFRLCGAAGFIIGDFLCALAAFFLFAKMFQLLGARRSLALGLAVLLVCGALQFNSEPLDMKIRFWGWRIPRPFVSEIFFLAALTAMLLLFREDWRKRKILWVGTGLAFAALIQADIHLAFIMLTVLAGQGLFLLGAKKENRCGLLLNFAICGGACLLFSAPFIWQRLGENPDVPRRFGIFAVSRFAPLFEATNILQTLLAVVLPPVMAAFYQANRRKHFPEERPEKAISQGLLLLSALSAISFFALPLFCIATGKCAQPYHFRLRLIMLTSYALLAALAMGLEMLAGNLQRTRLCFPKWARLFAALKALLVVALFFVALKGTYKDADKAVRKSDHMRATRDYPEWDSLRHYRRDFAALAAELEKDDYYGVKVAATFDHQFMSWWLTFRDREMFLAEPFLSVVPDAEVESRLIEFCKMLGMTTEQFREFIQRRYVLNFWLSLNKYQASSAHAFSSLDEYTPEIRGKIAASSVYENWLLALPLSEEKRLLEKFAATPPGITRKLDLIVLTKDRSVAGLEPLPNDFAPVYENETFKVWRRKFTAIQIGCR